MKGRRSRRSSEAKRQRVIQELEKLGETIYNQIDGGEFPHLLIPNRSTGNILYDEEERAYVLGEKCHRRVASNISHLRPLTQLIWGAFFAKELLKERKTSTLRDVYYSSQAYGVSFKDQKESDDTITDLEAILRRPREEFNVVPEERSSIFGDLTIEYTVPGYEGKRVNLTYHPDGVMVGHALRTAEFIKTSAERVFAIEKGGTFTRFIEEKVHDCLLYTSPSPRD